MFSMVLVVTLFEKINKTESGTMYQGFGYTTAIQWTFNVRIMNIGLGVRIVGGVAFQRKM